MQILRLLQCNCVNNNESVDLQHYVDLIESVYRADIERVVDLLNSATNSNIDSLCEKELKAIWVVDKNSQPIYQSPTSGNPNKFQNTITSNTSNKYQCDFDE